MKAVLVIFFGMMMFGQSNPNSKVIGIWDGKLEAGGQTLRFIVHVRNDEGKLSGAIESPDQGPGEIAVDAIKFEDNKLTFSINGIGGSYEGTLKDGKLEGKWSQSGQSFDLNLKMRDKS